MACLDLSKVSVFLMYSEYSVNLPRSYTMTTNCFRSVDRVSFQSSSIIKWFVRGREIQLQLLSWWLVFQPHCDFRAWLDTEYQKQASFTAKSVSCINKCPSCMTCFLAGWAQQGLAVDCWSNLFTVCPILQIDVWSLQSPPCLADWYLISSVSTLSCRLMSDLFSLHLVLQIDVWSLQSLPCLADWCLTKWLQSQPLRPSPQHPSQSPSNLHDKPHCRLKRTYQWQVPSSWQWKQVLLATWQWWRMKPSVWETMCQTPPLPGQ